MVLSIYLFSISYSLFLLFKLLCLGFPYNWPVRSWKRHICVGYRFTLGISVRITFFNSPVCTFVFSLCNLYDILSHICFVFCILLCCSSWLVVFRLFLHLLPSLSNCLHFFLYLYSLGVTNFHSHFIFSILHFSLFVSFINISSTFLTFSLYWLFIPTFMSPFLFIFHLLSFRLTQYLSFQSLIHILFNQSSVTDFSLTLLPLLFFSFTFSYYNNFSRLLNFSGSFFFFSLESVSVSVYFFRLSICLSGKPYWTRSWDGSEHLF